MLETQPGVGLITVITAGRTLASATAELARHPDRTNLEEFQQAHWDLNRFAMGLSSRDVVVDDCPSTWTDKEVRWFTRSDLGLFLPEVASNAPHTGTNEEGAKAVIKSQHLERLFQTLNVYGGAGKVSKLLQRKYLDKVKIWVRILASQVGGRVVGAARSGRSLGHQWGFEAC